MPMSQIGAVNSFQDIEVCSDDIVENPCIFLVFQQIENPELNINCFDEQNLEEDGKRLFLLPPSLTQYNGAVPALLRDGYTQVCRMEDEIEPGVYALFSEKPGAQAFAGAEIAPQQPDMGGLEHPYPQSVPLCTGGMQLKRIILVKNPENDEGVSVGEVDPNADPYAVYGQPWWDPQPGQISEVEKFMQEAGAVGLCQSWVTNNPPRYGLFWVMKADPMAVFDNQSVASDAASMQRISEELMAVFPEEIGKCMPSGAGVMQPYIIMEEFNGRLYDLEMEKIPPYALSEASLMAIHIINEAGLIDTDENQMEILARILAEAREYNISDEDIYDIANELSYRFNDSSGFIYGMITIISLRIGEVLHYRNAAGGGIVEDYDLYAESVESAIMDGSIDLSVLSAGDTIRQPAGAQYNPMFNKISFPALNKYTSIATMIEPVLHECYHAWQDIQAEPMTTVASELQANNMGKRALMLFMGPYVITDDPVLTDILARAQKIQGEESIKTSECMGIPDSALLMNQELIDEMMESQSLWQTALVQELSGSVYPLSNDLFLDYYSTTNYFRFGQAAMMSTIFSAHQASKAMADLPLEQKDAQLNQMRSYVGETFMSFLQTEPMSFEQGIGAVNYLNYSSYTGMLLFFADREKYMEMMQVNAERERIDFIATALLFTPIYYDGI